MNTVMDLDDALALMSGPDVTVVPLGHTQSDGARVVGDADGGRPRGLRLPQDVGSLLSQTGKLLKGGPPSRFSPEERALLVWMDAMRLVAIVPATEPTRVLPFAPVLRESVVQVDEEADGSYRLLTASGEQFVLDELSMRMLAQVNGRRAFTEIADIITAELMASDDDRAAVAANEQESGRTLREHLCDAAVRLSRALISSGTGTLETAP